MADGTRPLGLKPVSFDEALAAMRRLRVVLPAEYYGDIQASARQGAFTVSAVGGAQQIEQVLASLQSALNSGQSFRDWQRSAVQSTELWRLPRWRRETIFRTNIQAAYAAGRAELITRNIATHPYLLYSAVNDSRTRPAHARMDGTLLLASDQWWRTHYPPNGYNCRCTAIPISKREAERRGLKLPDPGAEPDAGFEHSALSIDRAAGIEKAAANAISKAPAAVAAAVQAAARSARLNPTTPAEAIALGREAMVEIARTAQVNAGSLGGGGAAAVDARLAFRRALINRIQREGRAAQPVRQFTGAGKSATLATLAEAAARFPAAWVEATARFGALDVKGMASQRGRGYQWTNSTTQTIFHPKLGATRARGRYDPGDGVLYIRAGDTRLAVHEYGHRIQAALPSLDAIFAEYYRQRTAGETLRRLSDIRPGWRYGRGEVAREDRFVDPYFGKDYRGHGGPLEMLTMSLEAVLAESRHSALLFDRDREFVELVLGLLLHWRP